MAHVCRESCVRNSGSHISNKFVSCVFSSESSRFNIAGSKPWATPWFRVMVEWIKLVVRCNGITRIHWQFGNDPRTTTKEHFISNNCRVGHIVTTFRFVVNVTACCLRFISNCKTKVRTKHALLPKERSRALKTLIRLAQVQTFSADIKHLRNKGELSTTSNILSLTPFLDSDDLLRVGGRLTNSNLHRDQKYQITFT